MFHYLAFLIMTILVFKKKDWLNFFKISLFTGLIVIFYGFLEYIGFFWYPNAANFPFMALSPSSRPGSYIGNSAFLATYMFFIIAFATIIFFETLRFLNYKTFKLSSLNYETFKLLFWRYFSLLIIVLAIIMIFITGTRGAILGLGVGIFSLLLYFSIFGSRTSDIQSKEVQHPKINGNDKRLNLQKLQRYISVVLLIFILACSVTFWLTRDAIIWQKIPGLNRLAQTAAFDLKDSSTQMRLMNWRISFEAFKEKPILGWGPENFLLAYQKNYDPDMSFYGETWIDRAHNKVIDLGVMQGVFGIITYLLMFGGIFYLLFKFKEIRPPQGGRISQILTSPILAAVFIAYFVQNLVLFDQLTSYIPFFAVLGYLIKNSESSLLSRIVVTDRQKNGRGSKILLSSIAIFIVITLGYSLYAYNYIPYTQAKVFKESSEICQGKNLTEDECVNLITEKVEKAMYPYNFAQYNIRGQGVDAYYLNQYFYQIELIQNPKFEPLADLLIKGQEEIIKKEPYDVRLFIREVEMLNPKAANNNPELYKKTESLIRQALEIAPKRQELYYNLSFALSGQERYEESIETARYALSLSPDIARAHYHLGLMLYLADRNKEAAKELAIAEELKPDFNSFLPGDLNNIALIYRDWGQINKVAELIIKHLEDKIGPLGFGFKRGYYEVALRYFAIARDKENFIKVAHYLTRFADIKDDIEILIDLAEKEKWEIIDNL